MIFTNARLIFADGIRDGLEVIVKEGKIAAIGEQTLARSDDEIVDLGGNYLAPGFNLSFVYPQEIIDKLKSAYSSENVRSDRIAFMGLGYYDTKEVDDKESLGEFLYSDYVCEEFDYTTSTINNMSGMAVKGDCKFGEISMKVIGFNFETEEGRQIIIFYGADPSTYKKYVGEFLDSLKTLKIPNTVPINDPQIPFQKA